MTRKVLIVGAGYAGVEAALKLNRKGKKDDLDITILDKNDYHTLLTELHEVAGNRQGEETVRISLKEIFRDTRVKIVTDEITNFNFETKTLSGRLGEYSYDYCIIAIGSTPAFYNIPGLEENVLTLWSYDDAIKIREHIRSCFALAQKEKDLKERSRLLTFTVGGAGFTGVEMIGELAHWVKPLCREYDIDRKDVRLILIDMLTRVLPVLGEKNSAKAYRYMTKKLGIEIMLETGIKEMQPDRAVTTSGEIETRTMIWCAGVRCNELAEKMGFARCGRTTRIKTNSTGLTEHPGVYSIGDCCGVTDEKGVPFAAMVENALQTADGVALNILNDIRGKEQEPIKVKFHGTMVCIGNYFGVAEIMGRRLPSWLSLLMKYLVNAHYLFEIMGFRGPARYLKDEVVNRKQDKLFLEKHYSRKMQAWWLLPVRMFMGFYWLFEGIKKVTEGWLTDIHLAEFMNMTRGYQTAVDVVSSATGGGLRIDDIFTLKLHIVNLQIAYASKMIEGVPVTKDIFAKIDVFQFGSFNLVPTIIQNWALSSSGWELFFQIMVTLAEIAVGLMLLSGTFTFVASVISVGLMAMFVTSTGLYFDTWWLAFASIATMGGAGRAFGMDYYLLPWLNRVWEYFWKNRGIKLIFPRKKKKNA